MMAEALAFSCLHKKAESGDYHGKEEVSVSIRILIVDDHEMIRMLLNLKLELHKFLSKSLNSII